jgi:hypothetical protein
MTTPSFPNDETLTRRKRQRRLALAFVLALIAVAALLTPEVIGGRTGDQRLTTYSAEAQGAKLLYELAGRMGWQVERWTVNAPVLAGPSTVVAVLDPVQPIAALETHVLLSQVRAGAGLLYVMSDNSALNDSLHIKRSVFGGVYQATAAGTADLPPAAASGDTSKARRFESSASDSDAVDDDETEQAAECKRASPNGGGLPMWADQTVRLWRFQWTGPRPRDAVVFARSTLERVSRDTSFGRSATAAAGFSLGAGRVVVISDPDLLRNDVLRVCKWGLDVVTARMLDFLAVGEPPRNRLVFDEYHQGFGTHPGTLRAIVLYLSRVPSGHVLLQAMLGGLVLLLALGPRVLPPHDVEHVERRSPLEHVDALANAYARVGATRTATARLLRGVRRRIEPTTARAPIGAVDPDATFLAMAEEAPSRRLDVGLVRRALTTPVSRRDFESVGLALRRLEESLVAERK